MGVAQWMLERDREVFSACYILLDGIYRIDFAFLTFLFCISMHTAKLAISSALAQKKVHVNI